MAYTFVKAQGGRVGGSLVEDDLLDLARAAARKAAARKVPLVLPGRHRLRRGGQGRRGHQRPPDERHPRRPQGPRHRARGDRRLPRRARRGRHVLWNGPLGVFEVPPFDAGTGAIAEAVAASGAMSVVGGGDSVSAITKAGLADRIEHVSTGGGASLEFLGGPHAAGRRRARRRALGLTPAARGASAAPGIAGSSSTRVVPASWGIAPTTPVRANLNGDYTYLTDGYYASLDARAARREVAPTAAECLDAYVVPIALRRRGARGLPVPGRSWSPTAACAAAPRLPGQPLLQPRRAARRRRRRSVAPQRPHLHRQVPRAVPGAARRLPHRRRADRAGHDRDRRVRRVRADALGRLPAPAHEGPHDRRRGRVPLLGHRTAARPRPLTADERRVRRGGRRMARLAIFTERYTIRSAVELTALTNFRLAAFELGHELDFVFKNELKYLAQYDAVLIRALTDPLNTSYVVARWAEMMGKRVLDTSESIRVCCDKVNMYRRLQRADVPLPRPASWTRSQVTAAAAAAPLRAAGDAARPQGAELVVLGLRRQGDRRPRSSSGRQALPPPRRPHRGPAVPARPPSTGASSRCTARCSPWSSTASPPTAGRSCSAARRARRRPPAGSRATRRRPSCSRGAGRVERDLETASTASTSRRSTASSTSSR